MSYEMTGLSDKHAAIKNTYNKPAISFEEQLQKLKDNGLSIKDDARAICLLKHIN